jgi:hypothetical protein
LCKVDKKSTPLKINQNIYITSDEEIKDGDWYYDCGDVNFICKAFKHTTQQYQRVKIILTTDQDLIKDGVQSIPDEFLEWFVKNPSCEKVELKPLGKRSMYYGLKRIIIPKEESKQNDGFNKSLWKEIKSSGIDKPFTLEEPKQDEHYLDSYGCTKNEFELSLNFKKEEPKQENIQEFIEKHGITEQQLIDGYKQGLDLIFENAYKIAKQETLEENKIQGIVNYFKIHKPDNWEQEESIRQVFIDVTKEKLWAEKDSGDCGFSEEYVYWLEQKLIEKYSL